MTIEQVVRRFKKHRPNDELQAMVDCNISLKFIGGGCYRNAYQVNKLPLVVKFPNDVLVRIADVEPEGIEIKPVAVHEATIGEAHSQQEFRVLRLLKRKKYAAVHKYLPVTYYMDDDTGVSLTRKYNRIGYNNRVVNKVSKIGAEIASMFEVEDDNWDQHVDNFGIDDRGRIVVLDLGLLEPAKWR